MNFESALKILGLTGNPSHDQIVEAYREKVRANHPDKFDMANEKVKKVAEEEMKQINAAFNFLKQNFFKDNSEINRQEVVPEEQKTVKKIIEKKKIK